MNEKMQLDKNQHLKQQQQAAIRQQQEDVRIKNYHEAQHLKQTKNEAAQQLMMQQ